MKECLSQITGIFQDCGALLQVGCQLRSPEKREMSDYLSISHCSGIIDDFLFEIAFSSVSFGSIDFSTIQSHPTIASCLFPE